MKDNLINLRNKIIECFTCDEEMMSEDNVLERRIDEVLRLYVIEELNSNTMRNLSNQVKLNKTLNSFKFDDLFNVNKISGKNLKLYYKSIIDRELHQFNVESDVLETCDSFKLIIKTINGEIRIELCLNNNNKRYLWIRLSVNTDQSVPRESTSCNNATYFEYTIRNWINQI
jgi:hypothetical protein